MVAEHMIRTGRILGGYFKRLTPAKSAAPYVHQLHIKAMIFGSNVSAAIFFSLQSVSFFGQDN
jgi:hypothetical protein